VVPGQQPLPQRDQNKGDDCGLQEKRTEQAPILIDGAAVEQVESFKFLGVHITNQLEWSKHTKTVVKRARQNLFPLRRLKRLGMGPQILKRFYSCTLHWLHPCLVWQLLGLRPQRHNRGLCEQPSTSLGPRFLPSRTSIPGGVRGSPKKATLVIDCSLCYRIASGTGSPSLGPRGF
jgi:hypothetical protein